MSYLISSRLGHHILRRFLHALTANFPQIATLNEGDLKRIPEILDQYADAQLDFVDAAIIALAERYGIEQIMTLDRRDFSIVRPIHCDYLELLP